MTVLRPATLDEYLTWLRAWLDAGHQPTHAYNYPWPQWKWFTATRDFRLGGECGANAVCVIVPPGVEWISGNLGHNQLYLLDGPGQRGHTVPVFSDPLFELLPGVREFVAVERLKEAAWHRALGEEKKRWERMAADSDVPKRPVGSEETTT